MGNCCANPSIREYEVVKNNKPVILKVTTAQEIGLRYELGSKLGRGEFKVTLGREPGRDLGRGGEFGTTYRCKDRETNEELACKSISKEKLRTAIDIEDVRREVAIMRYLPDHPNVVSLKGTYEDDSAVHLVVELCGGGKLLDSIFARGYYSEPAAASVIKSIIQVVQMCHKHGVMHRDLKPENFMFADKKETSPLKVIDFGLSIFFKPGERFSEIVGCPYYIAPEV